jgi:modification methylase
MHVERHAIGIEYESRWADLARKNIDFARRSGASGQADVITCDARKLINTGPATQGKVALVLTSPPYGPSTHGNVTLYPGERVDKRDGTYSQDPGNLANKNNSQLLAGFKQILEGCHLILRSGGILAITVRPWRKRGLLIDLPAQVLDLAESIGFILAERLVALLAGIEGDEMVPRASFFQLINIRNARNNGLPLNVIAHEDVLIFRKRGPIVIRSPVLLPMTPGQEEAAISALAELLAGIKDADLGRIRRDRNS